MGLKVEAAKQLLRWTGHNNLRTDPNGPFTSASWYEGGHFTVSIRRGQTHEAQEKCAGCRVSRMCETANNGSFVVSAHPARVEYAQREDESRDAVLRAMSQPTGGFDLAEFNQSEERTVSDMRAQRALIRARARASVPKVNENQVNEDFLTQAACIIGLVG